MIPIDEGMAILACDPDSGLIAADWFEEVGLQFESEALRACTTDLLNDLWGWGSGLGSGWGLGLGSGWGSGSGLGLGWGSGLGWGKRLLIFFQMIRSSFSMLGTAKAGECYLIFGQFGLAFAARFVRRTGLNSGEFSEVWNIHDTHAGNNWGRLADGMDRDVADFRRFGDSAELLVIAIRVWKGELPAESGQARGRQR